MTVETPSISTLREISDRYGLELSDEDLRFHAETMRIVLDSYERLDALEEPKLPVSYPRGKVYRPGPDENERGAWYYRCEIEGASGDPPDGNDVWFSDGFRKRTEQFRADAGIETDWEPPDITDEGESVRIPLANAAAECEDKDLRRASWNLLAWSINTRTEYFLGLGIHPIDPQQPDKLELRFSSEGSLIGWLWLLLAERVAQGRPMQRCARCGSWYFQHPDAKRKH